MNTILAPESSAPGAAAALARLAEPHGYRFDGDRVYLHVRLSVLNHAAHQYNWALQLWACPAAPASARDLAGHLVAEVALPHISEVADEIEHIQLNAPAHVPAGNAEHFMVLVLAAGRPGQFDEIHDLKVYPRREQFIQPRMQGAVGYRIDGSRVHLNIERIENPRAVANRSGTLAVELWALPAPYAGGVFQGVPLAGVAIGALSGQAAMTANSFDLPFSAPPAGNWHFVLMLREWTAAGYRTRDLVNFNQPVNFAPAQKAAPQPVATPVPAKAAEAQPAVAPKAAAPSKTSVPKSAPEPPKAASAPKAHAEPALISVNKASETELAAVPGLTLQLARAIIKKRPFASLDELRKAKGITVKLLTAVRSRLKL